jgi:predicted nuclease of restriction endonuclease-like RecB superfamily
MLTKSEVEYVWANGAVTSGRIMKEQPHYENYAAELLALFSDGIGKTRKELERGVEEILEKCDECSLTRIHAFFKLLIEVSEFETDPNKTAAKIRRKVWETAAPLHPLSTTKAMFGKEEAFARQEVSSALEMPWEEIEKKFFIDVIEFNTLKSFSGYPSPKHLLNRYNIAQAQSLLLFATSLKVSATKDFKLILRYAKLAKLLFSIQKTGENQYELNFFGPASVLRETTRYGGSMGKFLPSLLRLEGWMMRAQLALPYAKTSFSLSPSDKLRPIESKEEEFDSSIESTFAKKWGSERRDGWLLQHEDEILWRGQRSFIPDFSFSHQDGRKVLFEIAGFWTPEYEAAKRETLRMFSDATIILAVPETSADSYGDLGVPLVVYKTGIKLDALLEKLSKVPRPTDQNGTKEERTGVVDQN